MEIGNEILGAANFQFPISSFEFRFSSFEFRVSIFQFLACAKQRKLFDHLPPELLYWRKKTFVKFESK